MLQSLLPQRYLTDGILAGITSLPGGGQISAAGLLGIGQIPGSWLDFGADLSAASWTTTGIAMRGRAATYTDTSGSGTIGARVAYSFGVPTFASSSAVTLTSASTVYIIGPPVAGTNTTFGTNAAASLVVAAGNVGIGTLVPASTVEINKATAPDTRLTWTTNTSFGAHYFYEGTTQTGYIGAYGSNFSTAAFRDTVEISATKSTGRVSLFTNGVRRLFVTENGNVGIGTTSPTALLTLTGSSNSTALGTDIVTGMYVENSNTTDNNYAPINFTGVASNGGEFTGAKIAGIFTNHTAGSTAGELAFMTRSGGTVAERMRIGSTGNVGIGTTTPQSLLSLGPSSTGFRNYNSYTDASNGEWYENKFSSNVAFLGTNKNGTGVARDLAIETGGVEVARFMATGGFRQGTGSALATNATSGFFYLSATAGTPTGVPGSAAAGAIAIIYDTTNHKIWVYDQPAGAWRGVALA